MNNVISSMTPTGYECNIESITSNSGNVYRYLKVSKYGYIATRDISSLDIKSKSQLESVIYSLCNEVDNMMDTYGEIGGWK